VAPFCKTGGEVRRLPYKRLKEFLTRGPDGTAPAAVEMRIFKRAKDAAAADPYLFYSADINARVARRLLLESRLRRRSSRPAARARLRRGARLSGRPPIARGGNRQNSAVLLTKLTLRFDRAALGR
jgi:hypothetical protein